MNDLRYSVRTLARMRGVAAVAIASLALGIAATTTMFSAVYAALLRPLPFDHPDRIVIPFTARMSPRDGLVLTRWSYPLAQTLAESVTSYESIATFSPALVAISGGNEEPAQIDAEMVAPDYFRVLRVNAALGRAFTAAEGTAAGAAPVAILSDRLWRRRYEGDPAIVGAAVRVNDVPLTIVGVMPAGFSGLSDKAEIWIPCTMAPRLTYAEYLTTPQLFMGVVARLRDDVTLEQANAELGAASRAFVIPEGYGEGRWTAIVRRAGDVRVDATLRRSVLALLGSAACVLLITCANVAGLLLARGRMRRRELAIRMAIGSGRGRIVRQLLAESLVLAAAAGTAGAVLSVWGIQLFGRYAPAVMWTGRTTVSQFAAPALDVRSLLFVLGITAATSVLCGLAPALDTARGQLTTALKEEARAGGPARRVFKALVVGEIALAVLLLAGAALLLGSFVRMQHLRNGFESDGVLTFWVRPPASRYRAAEGPAIIERLLTRVQQVPGVQLAAVNRCTPFAGCARTLLRFTDRPNQEGSLPSIGRHYISADYFRALGIPLLAGRVLTPEDRAGRPPVTVISESAARQFWPGGNPIGKRVWFGTTTGPFADPAHAVEVVGVVGDVKYEAIDWPNSVGRPEFYTSYLQFAYPDTMFVVKTRGAPAALVPSLRRAIADVDPALPIYDVLTLDERISDAVSRPRFNAALVAGFALSALLVSAVGVYGMLSYSVSTRLREIGVRLALGAAPPRIVRFILGEGLRLAAGGVVVGLAGALVLGRVTRSLVMEVSPTDPRIFAAVAIIMLGVAGLASFLPARRASAVDPMTVLRQD